MSENGFFQNSLIHGFKLQSATAILTAILRFWTIPQPQFGTAMDRNGRIFPHFLTTQRNHNRDRNRNLEPCSHLRPFFSLNLIFFMVSSNTVTVRTCPIDNPKLGVCADLLGLGNVVGSPSTHPCYGLINGLVDLEAAVCLCTALKAAYWVLISTFLFL